MLLPLLSLLTLTLAASPPPPASTQLPTSITLAYTPLQTSTLQKLTSPKTFATLAYHAQNNSYTLTSYNAPSPPPPPPSSSSAHKEKSLARIGLLPQSRSEPTLENDGSSGFAYPSTTVADLEVLSQPSRAVLRIVLDSTGKIFSVGVGIDHEDLAFSPMTQQKKKKIKSLQSSKDTQGQQQQKQETWPRLEVLAAAPEPRPVLNRPVVLDENGKVPGAEKPQPTMLQKYWWVIALGLMFTLLGGGGGGEEGGK